MQAEGLADHRQVAPDKELIKFLTHTKERITAVDADILHIKSTVALVQQQIQQCQDKIATLQAQMQTSLRNKDRERALSLLKHQKALKNVLDKRHETHMSLDNVLMKIRDAEGDAQVMAAFEKGASAIKVLMERNGLTADKVHDTMDQLEDVMADYADVQAAMDDGQARLATPVDDGDLERELEQLIQQEEMTAAMKGLNVDDLPSVPVHTLPEVEKVQSQPSLTIIAE
jgi:charged multivesicular body protein 7